MRQSSRIRIEYLSGPDDGKIVAFSKDAITVGRDPGQDVVLLHDPAVSRRHARLVRDGDHLYVEDVGSQQGTFVDGQRVETRTELRSGMMIRLGNSWFGIP